MAESVDWQSGMEVALALLLVIYRETEGKSVLTERTAQSLENFLVSWQAELIRLGFISLAKEE